MSISRFFKRAPSVPAAKFLEQRVGYAVGDIHGRADLLGQLLDLLESRVEEDRRAAGPPLVVFLGDYVDRGPQSASVIDMLLDRPKGFERRFLMGNHEQSMLAFLAAPMENKAWLMHGGADTLMSYGVKPPPSLGAEDSDWSEVAGQLKERVPEVHGAFLARLERYVQLGDYAFVHAGVDPGRPMEEQTDADLFWIRDRFLSDKRHMPLRVVHGHTPAAAPYADHRRVGIDTGAYASGVLTAARFEGENVSFVSVRDPAAEARAAANKKRDRFRRR